MYKNLYKSILLGAVWGIIEATSGYILHMFADGIGWLLWFPIAFFFIHKSFRWTGSFASVMLTAAVAALIKLINLFFPCRADMVINPSASIILEALSVIMVYSFAKKKEAAGINVFDVLIIGFTWRALYLSYIFLMPRNWVEISAASDILSFTRFMFYENTANTLLITAVLEASKRIKGQRLNKIMSSIESVAARRRFFKPAISVISLALAAFIRLLTL